MPSGIVEGYYGKPYSAKQREMLLRYLSQLDESAYLYAPKNDPYHRMSWRDEYPPAEWMDIESCIKTAVEHKVQFYFAVSPWKFEDDEYDLLASKVRRAVRADAGGIAVLFDDIPEKADSTLARRQIEFTRRALAGIDVPVILCPVIYCEEFVEKLNGAEYLKVWRDELPAEWDTLWTGSSVISKSLSKQDTSRAVKLLGREPVIWDNLHANDYCMRRLFFGKLDGRLNSSGGYFLNPSECFPSALHSAFRLLSASGGGEQWPVELGRRLRGWHTLSGYHNNPWTAGAEVNELVTELRAALHSGNSESLVAKLREDTENLNELISAMQTIEGGFDLLPYIIDVRKILVWWINALEKTPVESRGRELRRQIERICPEHPLAKMTFAVSDNIE